MKKINIEEVVDGYIFTVEGTNRENGVHVRKHTEEEKLTAEIGRILCDYKVKVSRE